MSALTTPEGAVSIATLALIFNSARLFFTPQTMALKAYGGTDVHDCAVQVSSPPCLHSHPLHQWLIPPRTRFPHSHRACNGSVWRPRSAPPSP